MKKSLIRLLSRLPFCILYFISDIIYLVLYYIVKYRREVVQMNLRNSFPDKSDKELKQIERDFFRFLCDYGVESFKLLTIKPEEMKQHMVFENCEAVDRALDSRLCLRLPRTLLQLGMGFIPPLMVASAHHTCRTLPSAEKQNDERTLYRTTRAPRSTLYL